MNHTTATTRVLLVPELFDMVIQDMDQSTLTKAARVNKHWSGAALACLWESQVDLKPLFNLLATKGYELKDNKLVFKGLPTEQSWRRFFEYSRRIKSLRIDDTEERDTFLLDTFARLRPFHIGENGNLFPSLRSLRWTGATETSLLHRSVLFMHPGIRKFHVTLPSSYVHTLPGDALRQYVDHVIGRMPNIAHLAVIMKGYAAVVEPSVLQLIKGYTKTLETLEVPKYWTSSALIEILSSLPRFRNLQIRTSEKSVGVYDPARRFKPSLLPNVASWPSLEKLHLSAPYGEVTDFLRRNTLPPSVVELFIYTPRQESRSAVRELCSVLARKCQSVRALRILKCMSRPLDRHIAAPVDDCLSIDDFIPLFTAIPLTEFCFHHEFPMFFKDSKVPEVAALIPNIEFLDLNSCPDYDPVTYSSGDFISLKSLSVFSKLCPQLNEMAMYIDSKNADFTIPLPTSAPEYELFENLYILSLGGPGLAPFDMNDTLIFLSQLLVMGCETVSATVHRSHGIHYGVQDRRHRFWSDINQRLPLLVRVRMEEEERRERLYDVIDRAEEEIRRCGGDISILDDPEQGDAGVGESAAAPASSIPQS